MSKNWKTTLAGLLAAAGPVVKTVLPPEWQWIGDGMLSVGAFLTGKFATDAK